MKAWVVSLATHSPEHGSWDIGPHFIVAPTRADAVLQAISNRLHEKPRCGNADCPLSFPMIEAVEIDPALVRAAADDMPQEARST